MVSDNPNSMVVKRGVFLYDDLVECDIRIVFSPIRYGSGDYEDPEEIGNDVETQTFYIELGSTTQRGVFNAGGGCHSTLEQAIHSAQQLPGIGASIKWLE